MQACYSSYVTIYEPYDGITESADTIIVSIPVCSYFLFHFIYSIATNNDYNKITGHITSLSVLRTHRKRGIATALMRRSQKEMADVFDSEYVSLHVRKSNRAAFHLYSVTLAYEVNDVEKGYYADGEDAYDMRCYFKKEKDEDEEVGESSSSSEAIEEEESSSPPSPPTEAMGNLQVSEPVAAA